MQAGQIVELCSGLIGALGVFLLGMKNMSDGMQAVAGTGLRRMIGAVTDNRFLATAVGTGVTCVVQSSLPSVPRQNVAEAVSREK